MIICSNCETTLMPTILWTRSGIGGKAALKQTLTQIPVLPNEYNREAAWRSQRRCQLTRPCAMSSTWDCLSDYLDAEDRKHHFVTQEDLLSDCRE
jgi:hypothetical protein